MSQSKHVVSEEVHKISSDEVVFDLDELQKAAHSAVMLALRNVERDLKRTQSALNTLSGERDLIKARIRTESLIEHSQFLYRLILSLHALEEAQSRGKLTFDKGESK